MGLFTYQDFERAKLGGVAAAVRRAIDDHRATEAYRIAVDADTYDRQKNSTITAFSRWMYSMDGKKVQDTTSSNNKLASNFFRRLNTQRVSYSLGNGVKFEDDDLKPMLGQDFDTKLRDAGYLGLIHGVSFVFLNVDRVHVFKLTEFAPLWDEETGALRAGVRFWQIDKNHPLMAVLYEEDGYTTFKAESAEAAFEIVEAKRAYRIKMLRANVDAEPEVVGEENYTALPVVPLYGSRLKQSTLVGLKALIDAYDLIRSGFANDLDDCSEIYWIISNAGGMDDADLARFRDRLKLQHIANVADADDVSITPHTQEVPYASRKAFLDDLRAGIYEDFGALDVHTVAAGATNDHIQAAYQPMDENADDFEYQVIEAIQAILRLLGEDGVPLFNRNRIANEKERTEMVMMAASYLDDETLLSKLPFITPDELEVIMKRKDEEDYNRFGKEVPDIGEDEDPRGADAV